MFKLPFSLLPAAWGLKGKSRQIAEAEYLLSGFELKKELLRLNEDMYTEKQFKTKSIDLLLEFGKLTKAEHLRELANLIEDDKTKQIALLELDFKEGKTTETEYQKQTATINGEPWVTVLNLGFSGTKALEGSFELDWNDFFVDDLRAKGYVGPTEDAIVNQWFMAVCKNVALEEFDGTGDFTADAEANFESLQRWNSEAVINGRKIHK